MNEETAGQILRSLGVTIEATREAVSAENTHQLASLGIHADLPSAGPIVFHQTSGYEWSKRGSEIFKRASEGAKRVDASAIVRELVIEPSGAIEAILCRLGTTPETVTELLDGAERQRVRLDELEPEHLVQWSFIYPDIPKANSRRICIELEPASAGTQLRILSEWVRTAPHNRRAFLGFLRRPFYRLIIWMQLLQISSGISRVFR